MLHNTRLPYEYVRRHVRPFRVGKRRETYAERWWIHAEPRPEMRSAFQAILLATSLHLECRQASDIRLEYPSNSAGSSDCLCLYVMMTISLGVLHSGCMNCGHYAKGTSLGGIAHAIPPPPPSKPSPSPGPLGVSRPAIPASRPSPRPPPARGAARRLAQPAWRERRRTQKAHADQSLQPAARLARSCA